MNLVSFKEDFLFSLRYPRVRAGIAGVAVSGLLGLIAGVGYWWPAVQAANRLNVEIERIRSEISNAEYNLKLAQTSGQAVKQIALIERKLDTSFTQAALVQSIAALAHRHQVRIVSEAYEEGKPRGGYYAPLVHELTVQGGYSDLRSFIAGVQQLPTFTVVQEAVLSRSPNSSVIKAQLNIITYRRAMGPQR